MFLQFSKKMEIKKVLLRKDDGVKYIIVPRDSNILPGDYVRIIKIQGLNKQFFLRRRGYRR
jgi:hypothetical protein